MPEPGQVRISLRNRYRFAVGALLSTVLVFIGPATAWADATMTLDLVRHAQDTALVDPQWISTTWPGPGLTPEGLDQAQQVADKLSGIPFEGIYASQFLRTQETAAPLAKDLGMSVQVLGGLNEINAGIFNGLHLDELTPLESDWLKLSELSFFAWTLGLYFVPNPTLSLTDPNGMAFEARYSDAIQTIYDAGAANGSGNFSEVAFSHSEAMEYWTLMNVKNPDLSLIFEHPLSDYTATVEIQGSPSDGWTLVNWDGIPVPQHASLPTELFVDVRDLITAPQMAAYNLWQAVLSGDPTTILNAAQDGFGEVTSATLHFPVAVGSDILAVLPTSVPGFTADLATFLPTVAADIGGFVSLSAMVGDMLLSL